MNSIELIFENRILWVAITSWFIAQALKVIFTLWQDHRLDLSKMWASGGMPSSHSAFVMSLAISAGQVEGYNSTSFAIAAVLSFVVMYDAANVRLQAGKQAARINQIVEVLEDPELKPDQRLKEILGHTPFQVVAGGILGFVVAILSFA